MLFCESGQMAEVQKPEVFNLLLGGGFKYFFIFTPSWGRFPFWPILFKGVETTNQGVETTNQFIII